MMCHVLYVLSSAARNNTTNYRHLTSQSSVCLPNYGVSQKVLDFRLAAEDGYVSISTETDRYA